MYNQKKGRSGCWRKSHDQQALAAVGQGRLIALWDNLFSQLDQPIAQILLTRMDISDVRIYWNNMCIAHKVTQRTRYLNAQNTFSELLQMGVIPIVNENDTVSVSVGFTFIRSYKPADRI